MSPNKTGEKIPSANGAVYKQEVDGTLKCVKWLKTKPLEQEIQTLLQLKHENLVQLLSVYQENDETGLVYEWMEDGTLCQFLSNRSVPLTSDLQKTWALQVCRGLDYLHSQKLIHRDLKPENVLLTGDFLVAKIAFGLERQRSYEMDLYKAPELGQGKRNTVQSNVYALGLILYEIFASQTLDDRLEDDDVQLADPNLSRIIKQCLSVVRTQRPTIAEMLSVLAQLPGVYLTLKSDMEDSAYSSPVQAATESVHEVCKSGNVQQMRELLRSANVNERDRDGSSPLFYAAEMGHLEMCRQLILRDADCNLQNNFGETPMHAAAANGRLQICLLLMESGALPGVKNKLGKTPLDVCQTELVNSKPFATDLVEKRNAALLDAAEKGDFKKVQTLIEQGVDPNCTTLNGSSALHVSIRNGHLQVCKLLLESGCKITKDHDESTPLHYAAAKNHVDICQLLLEHGADSNARDDSGFTPFFLAVLFQLFAISKLLLENGADANIKNKQGLTPLHFAAHDGSLEICKLLHKHAADLQARDRDKLSPLHMASLCGHSSVCKFLLEYGVDINVRCKDGKTPLHLAAFNGHLDTCKLLVESGANIYARTDSGVSVSYIAKNEQPAVYLYLRKLRKRQLVQRLFEGHSYL